MSSSKQFAMAALTNSVAELVTLPINTVKTNYQLYQQSIPKVINHIYMTRGIYGFYNAAIPAVMGQVLTNAGKYTIYNWLKEQYPANHNSLNGLLGGLIVSVVTHPLDWAKIQMQKGKFTNWYCYTGYTKSLVKVVPSSLIVLPLYDFWINQGYNPLMASGLTAGLSAVIIHPLDYIKTRHVGGESWKTIGNPYRGLTLNLARVVPHFMIAMTLIEMMK